MNRRIANSSSSNSNSLGTGMITVASQVRVEMPAMAKEAGFKGFFHLASPTLPGARGNGPMISTTSSSSLSS
jgi:hypothetical protein